MRRPKRQPGSKLLGRLRLGRGLRDGAAVGVAAGIVFALASIATARPALGIPGWAGLLLACACLLVREAVPARGGPSDRGVGTTDVRRGRTPR